MDHSLGEGLLFLRLSIKIKLRYTFYTVLINVQKKLKLLAKFKRFFMDER